MRPESAHLAPPAADHHATHSHGEHEHFVQFCDQDEALLELVGDYLGEGLRNGELVVVIATEEHRQAFRERLARQGLPIEEALARGRAKLIDARATMDGFMVNGLPDWQLFRETTEALFATMDVEGARSVRAYTEMVDILWRDRNPEAAIQLEEHWNDLRRLSPFTLSCAYVMASFYKQPGGAARLAQAHAHASDAEPSPGEPVHATEFAREIVQRKAVERELRACLRKLRAAEESSQRTRAELERATAAKARYAERSAKITSAIAQAVSAEQVYQALVDQTAEALTASSAGLWLVEDDEVSATLVHSVGYSSAAKAALARLRLQQTPRLPVLDAIRSQRPIYLSSRAELFRAYPHLDTVATPGRSYSVVCIPLAVQGRALGGLGFTFEEPGHEDRNRSELLDSTARYGAQALERLRLLERERRSRNHAELVAHRLGVLSHASVRFAEVGPESDALLESLVRLVCAEFAEACGVLLRSGPELRQLSLSAFHHRRPELAAKLLAIVDRIEFAVGKGLTGKVAETGESVWFEQVDQERLLALAHPDTRACVAELAPSSMALVPMRVRGRVIGVLAAAQGKEVPPFDAGDVELLAELAERAALAVENSRLYEANEQARRRAEILHALAGTVNQAATLEQVFEAALEALSSALDAQRSSILTFDDDDVMRFKAWHGLSAEYRAAVEGHSPWSRKSAKPTPILVSDVSVDQALAAYLPVFEAEGIRALGFIPLIAGGKLLGKFMIYFGEPHAFSEHEREVAVAVANHVAAAIMRFWSVKELQRTVHFNEVFTAMLGHDLRNPLSGITAAAQVMLMRPDAPQFAKPLARILRSGDRMSRMIDQLLDFTRVRLGSGIPIRREPSDLHEVMTEVVEELRSVHPGREVNVRQHGDCRGQWDVDRLAQVFSNLVANAIHHGADRPVDVHLDGTAPGRVEVRVHNDGTIQTDVLPKLFEPLAGRDRRSEKSAGLGLGLYISRQVVLAHAGTIEVDSDAALGTLFKVTLPRSRAAEA